MPTNSVDVPPDTMEDWMRWVEFRLRKLDRHRHPVVQIGEWVLEEDTNGDLIAVHSSGSQTVLASP